MKKLVFTLLSAFLLTSITYAQSYSLDKAHARLSFESNHMGISFVDGIFKDFDATLVSKKADFSDAQITMTAQVKSIDTRVEMRDEDLRKNFFETDKYPTITFKSKSFKKVSGNKYKLSGDLTMHGVTKPIVFDVVLNGSAESPFNHKTSYGFTISGKLNRSDYGVDYELNLVGDEVILKSNVEFVKE